MVISFTIIATLLFCASSTSIIEEVPFLKEEIVELREECSKTFLTNRGTYISFYYAYSETTCENNEKELLDRSNYGSSYISNKSMEIGTTNIDQTLLMVGHSQFVNPATGLTAEYQTAFNLSLPNLNLNYISIRDAGFAVKKQSGQLTSLAAYTVYSPSYALLDGNSVPSKDFISYLSFGLSYASLDITDEIIDAYESSSSSLTILLQSTATTGLCYLYGVNGLISSPYYYIEYDNYGSARPFFNCDDYNINCMGYALYSNSWLSFTDYLPSNTTFFNVNLFNNPLSCVADISYVLNCCMCDNIDYISSYSSIIESTQRRIALRFLLSEDHPNYGFYNWNFHFMWQTNNGSWAAKSGNATTCSLFAELNAPDVQDNWILSNGIYYNSQTYYFAIEKD